MAGGLPAVTAETSTQSSGLPALALALVAPGLAALRLRHRWLRA
ncbi:hypothetical protein [Antribacter gilvus]|nr:hypothetical protein [Antribacter gilvus]